LFPNIVPNANQHTHTVMRCMNLNSNDTDLRMLPYLTCRFCYPHYYPNNSPIYLKMIRYPNLYRRGPRCYAWWLYINVTELAFIFGISRLMRRYNSSKSGEISVKW